VLQDLNDGEPVPVRPLIGEQLRDAGLVQSGDSRRQGSGREMIVIGQRKFIVLRDVVHGTILLIQTVATRGSGAGLQRALLSKVAAPVRAK
jgi:hypothetical protein